RVLRCSNGNSSTPATTSVRMADLRRSSPVPTCPVPEADPVPSSYAPQSDMNVSRATLTPASRLHHSRTFQKTSISPWAPGSPPRASIVNFTGWPVVGVPVTVTGSFRLWIVPAKTPARRPKPYRLVSENARQYSAVRSPPSILPVEFAEAPAYAPVCGTPYMLAPVKSYFVVRE